MPPAEASRADQARRHRPSRLTVFTTAFVAGAAVAFGVNRMLDVHLAQARPQVECEPIFVALHSLPQGSPITVWDVALKDWPRAMLPVSALRARDTFEGMVLRHPLREGQPLLAVQLMPAGDATSPSAAVPAVQTFTAPLPAAPAPQAAAAPDADLWAPAAAEVASAAAPPASRTDIDVPVTTQPSPGTETADTFVAPQPAATPTTAAAVDAIETDAPSTVAQTEPMVSEPAADHEPELAEPQLVATTPPLYAPVPASPPSSLDATLSGVGGLTAAGESAPRDPGSSVLTPMTAAAPAAPAPQTTGRYLVVPERIALQADTSFAPPPPARATPPVRRPQPASTGKNAAKPTNRAATANRATGPQRPETRRSQPQQPTASAGRQPAATAPGRQRAAMFPNLAAGLEALGGSQRKPAAADQSPATTR